MTPSNKDDFKDFEVIHTYTRKQAVEDGVLVDVTTQAKEAGFKIPVAVSAGLYHEYVVAPSDMDGEGQSTEGRLFDLFMMTQAAAATRSWQVGRIVRDI